MISGQVFGEELVIKAHRNFAYAIHSIQFRGKEFIDYYDHGRQLQSASSFDGYGECFNPTEAGSTINGDIHRPSTSVPVSYFAKGNAMRTITNMAFWMPANLRYDQPYCGTRTNVHSAVNQTDLSGHLLEKNVTIGFQGIENVLSYSIKYTVPEAHSTGTFEALTGYMPAEFSSYFTYEPASRTLKTLDYGPGEQSLPLILSTPNREHAMGVYSPTTQPGYGRFRFTYGNDINKWNCVYRETGITANATFSYRCFVIIGTLEEVKKGMDRLHAYHYPIPKPNSKCANGATNPPQCTSLPTAPKMTTTAIYEMFNGRDYFETAKPSEGTQSNYEAKGIAFRVYSAQGSGMIPLHRCLLSGSGDHFVSLMRSCENERFEGVYGYGYPVQSGGPPAGHIPLYRMVNPRTGDHAANTMPTPPAGYQIESVLGYVPEN